MEVDLADGERDGSKVALVTGASSGIGWAIAELLARNGYKTYGTSRHSTVMPAGVFALPLDVTQDDSVERCVAAVLEKSGQIDLLVNNAGFAMVGALEESTIEQAKSMFETNVFGPMRMVRAVLPGMRARRTGRIVNVSSIVGFLPAPFSGLYATTKHALEGYSESLDHEVRTMGIRAILVEPGFTSSKIGDNMPEADAKLSVYDKGRTGIHTVFAEALAKAAPASTVAEAVLRASQSDNPKVRYQVGREAATLATLRRLMPTRTFEKSFRKQFRLEPA